MAQAMLLFAGDAALMKGMQQVDPLAWCIRDGDQQKLKQHVAYLAQSRALPSTTISNIEECFTLTQASVASFTNTDVHRH